MTFRILTAALVLALAIVSCAPAKTETAQPAATPVEAYRAWLLQQGDSFVIATNEFTDAVIVGNRDKAKELYAPSRMFYERIEPIAEALGDFDPRIDARDGDVPAEEWKGYHWLEKLLWSNDDLKTGIAVAQTLAADVKLLRAKLETAEFTAPSLVAGAVELLNEVSTSKVTGEEERYSRTDLWDFEANVEGAEQIWQILSPTVRTNDAELAKTLDARFSLLYGLLDGQKKDGKFRLYNEVSPNEIKALSEAVDGLAEPLAQLGKHFPSE